MSFGLSAGALGAIGAVGGALISSSAAGDAADTQAASSAAATAEQKRQYDLTRADYEPYRNIGYSGLNQLAMLLGLPSPQGMPTREQFTTAGTAGTAGTEGRWEGYGGGDGDMQRWVAGTAGTAGAPGSFDQAGYDRAMAGQDQSGNPQFGSLMKTFTGADLENEPGYRFGLQQGQQAIDRSAASRGNLYSGATLKGLQRFGQDYGGTKFNEAYNRDSTNKNRLFNMLSGVAGTGQTATGQVANAGQNYSNNAASMMLGTGNVRAATGIAQGNAWQNALNQGVSSLKNRTPTDQNNIWSPTYDDRYAQWGGWTGEH